MLESYLVENPEMVPKIRHCQRIISFFKLYRGFPCLWASTGREIRHSLKVGLT